MNAGIFNVVNIIDTIPEHISLFVNHQVLDDKDYSVEYDNIKVKKNNAFVLVDEKKGLSRSRNTLINAAYKAEHSYLLISDDDVLFNTEQLKELSIYLGRFGNMSTSYWLRSITKDGVLRKVYPKNGKVIARSSLFKVASIELCLNLRFVKQNRLYFDTNFGLGTNCRAGEEPIFISDCLKRGMIFMHLGLYPAIHPIEGTGSLVNNDLGLMTDRALIFSRMFGSFWGLLVFFVFFLKKKIKRETSLSYIAVFTGAVKKVYEKL
ncbi:MULTISPECIES: glycosyltransferase [Vibrio]|uniref:glycosyltransferase n=1 Tax=Vibrio TaxID=662 RepID=UPI0020C1B925|nr:MULTISPECIES: glycosyltransferase [Vibrio]MDW2326719.1 glycosyltransferase [Vibrio sp. 1401]